MPDRRNAVAYHYRPGSDYRRDRKRVVSATHQIAQTTVRNIVGQSSLDDILSERWLSTKTKPYSKVRPKSGEYLPPHRRSWRGYSAAGYHSGRWPNRLKPSVRK